MKFSGSFAKKMKHLSNNIVQHLDADDFTPKLLVIDNEAKTLMIPEKFSVSEDSETAIVFFRYLYMLGRDKKVKCIILDFKECTYLGISANIFLDIICISIWYVKGTENIDFSIKNILSEEVANVFRSGALYKATKMRGIPVQKHATEVFRLEFDRCTEEGRVSGYIATKLTNFFNNCLHHERMNLQDEGCALLSVALGEVVNNCEIHGDENSTWYVGGYYEAKSGSRRHEYGEMQLVFMNIGTDIYEGLNGESVTKETSDRMRHILESHSKYINEDWTEEMIYTVSSLQSGISRLRDCNKEGYQGRGSGTVRLIEMFDEIGKTVSGLRPTMTIISGNTKIIYDGTYKMKSESFHNDGAFGSGKHSIIAFNKENNIYQPSDDKYVIRLQNKFPGTVISLRFYLDYSYIMKKERGRKR